MSVVDVISIIALIISVLGVLWLIKIAASGDPEREAEAAARDYFSEHGHWPDEAPPGAKG
jgi:hypothetical protein